MTARRRAVWISLSDLFLDTDVTRFRDQIIAALKASGYDLPEIDSILRDEVAPVCLPNLLLPAGEGEGFDETWLCTEIARALDRPRRFGWLRSWWRARTIARMVPDWAVIRSRLADGA